jgi:hypothetical protein
MGKIVSTYDQLELRRERIEFVSQGPTVFIGFGLCQQQTKITLKRPKQTGTETFLSANQLSTGEFFFVSLHLMPFFSNKLYGFKKVKKQNRFKIHSVAYEKKEESERHLIIFLF